MSEHVLEVENLSKRFGDFKAVDSISFAVPKGKIIGFLGPNGAGKTTTIHMLLGITDKSDGAIRYFGSDFHEHRLACLQRINSTSAFGMLLGRVTVWENLRIFAELYQVPDATSKVKSLLKRFEAEDLVDIFYWHLSAGQRTRVNLIKSLLNDPEIILMDEPTASLDPDIADKTLTLIEELRSERGISILYTSHNMAEITRICDEVVFLDHGTIVAHDTPGNLAKRVSAATLRLTFAEPAAAFAVHFKGAYTIVNEHVVEISSEESKIPQLLFDMSHLGSSIRDIEIKKPTLEDVFLQIARK